LGSQKIYRSENFGASWIEDGEATQIRSRVIKVDENGTLYAQDHHYRTLHISSDGGRNWRQSIMPQVAIEFAPSAAVIFAWTPDGLYRSKDSGTTWLAVSPASENSGQETLSIFSPLADVNSMEISRDGTLYAAMRFGTPKFFERPDQRFGGIFKSDGHGSNWQLQTFGLTPETHSWRIWNYDSFTGALYFSVESEMYRSLDGETATRLGVDTSGVYSADDGSIFAITDELLYKSVDAGKSWHPLSLDGIA
jgi:hypothetical protein